MLPIGAIEEKVGKVLRIKKIPLEVEHEKKGKAISKPGEPVLTEEEQKLWAEWPAVAGARSPECLLQAYARDVMSPLLGSDVVDPGILVHVTGEFLENVAHNVEPSRPCSRINASRIDTRSGSALLISDHSIFWPLAGAEQGKGFRPSISVEIKPKCGFLPNSDFIVAENSIKKMVPRFTMHQVLKLLEGQVKVLSQYSPLDFFSENLARIKQAVGSLFETPQNNLRVFVGGSIIDTLTSDSNPDSANGQNLREALKRCMSCEDESDPVEVVKELVAQSLYDTNVLRNLLAAQKLDTLDIEGAIHAYRKVTHSKAIDGNMSSKLDKSKNQSADFLDGMSLSECRELVRNYLIAATAKDCSLMLTFQQVPDSGIENANKLISSSKTRNPFRLKINLLDLDLKPLRKMPYYYRIDQEIVRAYVATTQCGTDHARDAVRSK